MSRLTIVTGKGGVGKSTFAMVRTLELIEQGKKVFYINFSDENADQELKSSLNLQSKFYTTKSSMTEYVARKLGSQTIARWINETAFFSALFNILPSLGMMITLGHIVNDLENDPDLHYVLDAPATGHTLALLESTLNYRRIFGRGVLVDDIDRINNFLFDEHLVSFVVVTLPTEMALEESFELRDQLKNLGHSQISIILNDCLFKLDILKNHFDYIPTILKNKLKLQEQLFSKNSKSIIKSYPHISTKDPKKLITELLKFKDTTTPPLEGTNGSGAIS